VYFVTTLVNLVHNNEWGVVAEAISSEAHIPVEEFVYRGAE
jgi:hypothetical protein